MPLLGPAGLFLPTCMLKDTSNSSIVTIMLRINLVIHQITFKNELPWWAHSCFQAVDRNFGTQNADFFTRHRSSVRISWTIQKVRPCIEASSCTVKCKSSSTELATAARMSAVLLIFLGLECQCSKVFFPPLFSQIIWFAALNTGFISFLLFPALGKVAIKYITFVIVLSGWGHQDS